MSHRRLRAARSLIAVAALALSALVVPQLASADTGVPNTATITVHDGVSSTLGNVPHAALPAAIVEVGTTFGVEVSLTIDGIAPAGYPYGATVALTENGPGVLTTTTGALAPLATSVTIPTSYTAAADALVIRATVTPNPAPSTGDDDPPTVLPPLQADFAAFSVYLKVSVLDGQSAALKNGTAGADGSGCAVVDRTHPMCGVVNLPQGATGGTALTLGVCPAGAACAPGGLVTQFLGDLTSSAGASLYTRQSPASMTIICDKTLCGGAGVTTFRALWSTTAAGALTTAPPCPAKGVIGADQDFCTDLVASSRLKAGDLRLVVLFLTDVRGTI